VVLNKECNLLPQLLSNQGVIQNLRGIGVARQREYNVTVACQTDYA
jgi:hypothetical protein